MRNWLIPFVLLLGLPTASNAGEQTPVVEILHVEAFAYFEFTVSDPYLDCACAMYCEGSDPYVAMEQWGEYGDETALKYVRVGTEDWVSDDPSWMGTNSSVHAFASIKADQEDWAGATGYCEVSFTFQPLQESIPLTLVGATEAPLGIITLQIDDATAGIHLLDWAGGSYEENSTWTLDPTHTYTVYAYAAVSITGGNESIDSLVAVTFGNRPPIAVCQDTIVAIGEVPDIDGGSYDPDQGDTITLSQSPEGAFDEAGIYEVTLMVTDSHGATASCTAMVVVYDPSGGFVTGGGWIYSLPGAYVPDSTLEGKANFGFVSKYQKGAKVPTGNTEFQFHAAEVNFHSSSYEWLVVNQNGTNAQFKGIGTINGSGEYKFMLWASDDGPDTFRIKIWEETGGVEAVVYDNGFDQPVAGGSIVIHTKK
jgi:hypothetical protein